MFRTTRSFWACRLALQATYGRSKSDCRSGMASKPTQRALRGSNRMINIGVIGHGYWGPNLTRNFAELTRGKLAAVSDLDSRRLDVVARRFPAVKTTTDYQDLVRDPNIDAIAIATPVSSHFELAMAETSLQAQKLVDEADKRNRVFLIDHTFVYTGSIRKMGEIVSSGDLGQI